jgi:hypothetical protein
MGATGVELLLKIGVTRDAVCAAADIVSNPFMI